MENLTTTISSHPTKTFLRNEDNDFSQAYDQVPDIIPSQDINVPYEFDGRKVWAGLLTPVMNQGSCGSCWAFASSSTLSDRFNIQSVGLMYVQLSPTKLLLCDWKGEELNRNPEKDNLKHLDEINVNSLQNAACFGNSLLDAWRYLYTIGIPTIECVPYNSSMGLLSEYHGLGTFQSVADVPLCTEISGPNGDMCANYFIDKNTGVEGGDPERFYSAFYFYTIPQSTEKDSDFNIRYDIYKWGPVTTAMKVYPDFYMFDAVNDIYKWDGNGDQVGGHAIEITGWGNENGVPYWQVKNTWGVEWGDRGYFKMFRGVNMCGVEENVIVGNPNFFYPSNYSNGLPNEPTLFKKQREIITNSLKTFGGGIDTTTGYTRRVMITYPWVNFSRPVDLDDLPEWSAFLAGRDSEPYNRTRYQAVVKRRNLNIQYSNQTSIIYIIVMVILILIVIRVLWLIK
jgi:hypothetical protein